MILGCQLDEAGSKSMERNAWIAGKNAPMRQRCEVRLGPWGRAKGLAERLVTRSQGIFIIYFALLPLVIALGVGVCGCGGRSSGQPAIAPSDESRLDPWQGPLGSLFDDSIHPAAVGLSLEGGKAQDDPMLKSRAAAADLVARLTVTDVTSSEVGAKVIYHLTLVAKEPTLLAPRIKDRTIDLVVRQSSPAFGIVSSLDNGLRNKTFIGFLRRFAGEHGPELHWHLTADTDAVAAIVSTAGAFDRAANK